MMITNPSGGRNVIVKNIRKGKSRAEQEAIYRKLILQLSMEQKQSRTDGKKRKES